MTGGRSVLMVIAATCALTLASCTDDPAPPAPTPTTAPATPTTTATPTPTPPPEPSPAKSAAGAVSFVRYFWETYNYGYTTGDTAPLAAASGPGCGFCSAITEDVQKTTASGTRISGYAMTVLESAVPPGKITTGTVVVSAIRQQPGRATGTNGESLELKGFKSIRSTASLAWDQSGWQVEAVTNDPKTRVDW